MRMPRLMVARFLRLFDLYIPAAGSDKHLGRSALAPASVQIEWLAAVRHDETRLLSEAPFQKSFGCQSCTQCSPRASKIHLFFIPAFLVLCMKLAEACRHLRCRCFKAPANNESLADALSLWNSSIHPISHKLPISDKEYDTA